MKILMTYDLDANGDGTLNYDVKQRLMDMGWIDTIHYQVFKTGQCIESETPSTTLWKDGCLSTQSACKDFVNACRGYNLTHHGREAKGRVCCMELAGHHCSLIIE